MFPIGPPPAGKLMGFLQGYFDESGKHQTHEIVSFCGLVDSNWDALTREWEYLLRRNRIPHLHVSKTDLKATSERLRVFRPFVQVIKKHVEQGFATAVHVPAFNAAHKSIRSEFRDDAHFLAFQTVVRDVIKYAQTVNEATVSLICDDDPVKACAIYKMFDVIRQFQKFPENRRILKAITFGDAKYYYGLQAADLFAWICRAEAASRFTGKSYSLQELFGELNMGGAEFKLSITSAIWGPDEIKELERGCLAEFKRNGKKAKR